MTKEGLSLAISGDLECGKDWCQRFNLKDRNELLRILQYGFQGADTLDIVETALATVPIHLDCLYEYMVRERMVRDSDLPIRDFIVDVALQTIREVTCPCMVITVAGALWPLLLYPRPLKGSLVRMKHRRLKDGVLNIDGSYR